MKSWEEAASYCQDLGGHLASVNSQETKDFLEQYVLSDDVSTKTWFGGNNFYEVGVILENQVVPWRWADCAEWNNDLWSQFGVMSTNACLIYDSTTKTWQFSADCSSKFSFVCSKKICPGMYQL